MKVRVIKMLGEFGKVIPVTRFCWMTCIIVFLYSCGNQNPTYEPLPKTVDFNFHIRPILVQNCYLCHGPDPSSRKADLRLDTFEGATAALKEGGYAVVPGKPGQSELMLRINHEHEDKIMPPPETNSKLTLREKALLEKWIKQGAEWKPHWAFIKPNLSTEDQKADIDEFIDRELSQKKLTKASPADKNTLIRRVAYLLTGLPPTPEAVNDFVSNTSEKAYEDMVDTYLASAAYGERWARHWMDLVRYAETKGHEFDYPITGAWKYRDYLIRAFNNDLPYDQLLTEHLAGDLVTHKRYDSETGIQESQIATAFYAMGEGTHSPVDVKQDEANRIDNMIDVTTKTFQGLTVSCAKCHDHKFDPITAADYYAMYGVMESTRFTPLEADLTYDNEVSAKEALELQEYIKSTVVQNLKTKETEKAQIDQQITPNTGSSFKKLGDFRETDFDGWKTTGLAFGNSTTLGNPILAQGTGKLMFLDAGRASSKTFGPGVLGTLRSPDFILENDFIGVRAKGEHSTIRIIIDNFQLIQWPIYGELTLAVDSKKWQNYKFNVEPWKGHKAYIEILPGTYNTHNFELSPTAFVEAEYAIAYNTEWPGKIPNSSKEDGTEFLGASEVKDVNSAIRHGEIKLEFPELLAAVDSSTQLSKPLKSNAFIYGVSDGSAIDSPVFIRGRYQEPSEEKVPRRFLSVLPEGDKPFVSEGSGRLELAEAMLHKDNPLTSRVMVNRIWHHLFGKGIVETVDNYGLQGKLPSHPELLDHLALKFQEDEWSIKNMVKYIVMSNAFKRSTSLDSEASKIDPLNTYLASFPVRRLESEAIRDGILAVTESLDNTLCGPPVPTYLTEFMGGRGKPEVSGPLDGAGRRSIYQEVRRNFLEPMMTTFDRPIPFTTFGRRDVTNVPAQSLILMNDPFVIQQSELMAQKLLEEPNLTFDQRIQWVYMRMFSRKPTENEISNAAKFMDTVKQMKASNEMETDNELDLWKEYCHSVFNLKEFIYLI
ncbi:PSD1 and planctomycete cytochrome C domain-containing protein [Muricauda sp. 2012CJ35-5]|uniref:PSD1 and planctomycete cytochrome C domain-containing protein n=1 Tax=Flagellimonas spongiicola TaxID=2942208 RepID=A0ABT0PWQ2_9FLAO|nr:PSD1 and planctomycete cytochrome C domain-containing protein [Allomuricauda spongiicola]MCL6275411.1 PSD1 and planctomycete cytochrome C domain-containing protein [Allomuricauda spongiicola]